jgi:hypothetical protein
MDHNDLVMITHNYIRSANINKTQRRSIYEVIKNFIRNENINKRYYKISTQNNVKELTIDLNCLSDDCLIEILCLANYDYC